MAAHFARPIIERGVFSRRCILEPQGFDPTNGRGPDNRPPSAITALLVQLRCEQNGYVHRFALRVKTATLSSRSD